MTFFFWGGYFYSFYPKRGDKVTKTQGVTRSDREWKDNKRIGFAQKENEDRGYISICQYSVMPGSNKRGRQFHRSVGQ